MEKNRVIWHEGLFLRPQHLQQQDRFLQQWVEGRCRGLQSWSWGFTALELDQELLALGKLAILQARGIFPDGTPFAMPEITPVPDPLDIPEDMKNCRIFLALPLHRPNILEVTVKERLQQNRLARYVSEEIRVKDNHTEGVDSEAEIQIGKLNTRILAETDKRDAFTTLAMAYVRERKSDDHVVLDEDFLPTVMHSHVSEKLHGYVKEILGLLNHRGDALATRLAAPGAGGMAEIVHFLILQIMNRYEPLFIHLEKLKTLHPEDFYRIVVELAGELSTFTQEKRRPIVYPEYRHNYLTESFAALMEEIRREFNTIIEEKAIRIDLQSHKYNLWSARFSDKTLLTDAIFVLAVHAQVDAERIRSQFPQQVTMGTVENIRDLVNNHLAGVGITPLPAAPRQIPYHAGFSYFEINTRHEFWQALATSGGLAIHVGVKLPELALELWAIRE